MRYVDTTDDNIEAVSGNVHRSRKCLNHIMDFVEMIYQFPIDVAAKFVLTSLKRWGRYGFALEDDMGRYFIMGFVRRMLYTCLRCRCLYMQALPTRFVKDVLRWVHHNSNMV